MDVLSEAGPGEPEDPNGKADASDHGGRESPFWDGHVVVGGQFAVVAWRDRNHEDGAEELTCEGYSVSGTAGDDLHSPPIMPKNGNYIGC